MSTTFTPDLAEIAPTLFVPADPARQAPWARPYEIAPETFVIQDIHGGDGGPAVHLNAMVIRGAEPVVVDTGVPANRERYFEDLFGLVEPEDVRWVYLSHDDIDHYGNLAEVMERCPNAVLVTNWFMWERLGSLPGIPPWRLRWVSHGESFDAGDRTLTAIRPPLYDSPTTRGLYDPTTGVYWASDCFAALVPHSLPDVEALSHDEWVGGMIAQAQLLSPWLPSVDRSIYGAQLNALQGLGIRTIASCHSPTIAGGHVAWAFDALRTLPDQPLLPTPGADLLDHLIATAQAAAVG